MNKQTRLTGCAMAGHEYLAKCQPCTFQERATDLFIDVSKLMLPPRDHSETELGIKRVYLSMPTLNVASRLTLIIDICGLTYVLLGILFPL